MSTTADQIKSNMSALGFDNPSDLAIYNKIAQGVGIPIDNTITELQNSENRILETITTQRYGKSGYYTSKALAFQFGDDLVIDPVTLDYIYAVINPLNLIVKQAAFEEIVSGNSSQLFLKIAALDALSGDLMKLTIDQLAAFTNYYVNFEIPGLPITIISVDPNVLNFSAQITYFATYDFSVLQTRLQAALTAFKQSFAFNGELFIGDLEAYLKAQVPGIRDVYIFNTSIDGVPFGGSLSLNSGYFNYNPGITLSYVSV